MGLHLINTPVANFGWFWRDLSRNDFFIMQEHTDAPTLRDRYRIITMGRRGGNFHIDAFVFSMTIGIQFIVASADSTSEIQEDWDHLNKGHVR